MLAWQKDECRKLLSARKQKGSDIFHTAFKPHIFEFPASDLETPARLLDEMIGRIVADLRFRKEAIQLALSASTQAEFREQLKNLRKRYGSYAPR